MGMSANTGEALQELPATAMKQQAAGKAPGAFRTISEVGEELGLQQHVLRFWETKFSQIRPLKRGGGRRYYRPEDVLLLRRIHELLYSEGYTIRGVQKLLKEQGKSRVIAAAGSAVPEDESEPSPPLLLPVAQERAEMAGKPGGLTKRQRAILEAMLGDLKELRAMIRGPEHS